MEDEEYTYLPPVGGPQETDDGEYTYLPPVSSSSDPATPERKLSGVERIWESARVAAQEGFGGQVAQKYYDWSNYGHDELKKRYPDASPEAIESMADMLISQSRRQLANDVQKNLDNDPTWKPDASYWDKAMGTIQNFIGGMIGSSDPTMLIAPGANAVQRMGAQGVISGAADAGYQGLNIAEDYKTADEFDLAQVGMNTLFGVAGQGLFEIPAYVKDLFVKRGKDTTPDSNPANVASKPISNEPLSPEAEAEWVQLQQTGSADDMIEFMKRNNRMTDAAWIDGVRKYAQHRDATGEASSGVVYQDPIDGEINVPANRNNVDELGTAYEQADAVVGAKAKPKDELVAKAQDQVINRVNQLTEGWTNAPEIEVHTNFNDLPGIDSGAIGVTTPEGKVLLNVENIAREAKATGVSPEDMIAAVTFHESLGHHGLTQKFGDELDNLLDRLYTSSPSIQRQVDEWMENNADSIGNELTPHIRATEEVLAEMSEKGKIDPTLMERLRAWVRNTGRKMGLDLNFNDNEVKVILGMAHNAATNGKARDVAANGYRYARKRTLESFKDFDDEADLRRVQNSRYVEPTEYLDMPEMGPLPDEGMRMPTTNQVVAQRFEQGLDERGIAKHQKETWRRKQEQEPIGTDEKLTFDNGKEVDITTYTPNDLQRLIVQRMGSRYMKRRTVGPGSEGTIQGSSTREDGDPSLVSKFRSNRPIEGILDEVAPEKTRQTWDEWAREADDIKMTLKSAEALSKGAEPPQLKAAERLLIESANRIFDLTHKSMDQTLSPKEKVQLSQEWARAKRIGAVVDDITANAARLLNSRQMEVETDKALTTAFRNKLKSATPDDLTPEGVEEFTKKLVKDAEKARRLKKAMYISGNILNLPRSLMSSMDFSAPFRQAILLTHKKQFWTNLPKMFKAAFSDKYFNEMNLEIKDRPTYRKMKSAGLALTDLGKDLTKREEDFLSDWAGKIPALGHIVRGSERAYSGFLNRIRADVFDDLVKNMEAANPDMTWDDKALKDIAKFVNVATGRGNLGSLDRIAPQLAGIFFSPRLMAARLTALNPAYYVKLHPAARKEAIKSLLATATIASTVLGLLSMAGADVELDPRSSNFAKARFGNTRYDILGGFSQYITLGARLLSDQAINAKGDVKALGGGQFDQSRFDVTMQFLTNKGSPIASFVTGYMKEKDPTGQPFDTKKEVISRFVPMFAKDVAEMTTKYGAEGPLRMAPGMFGVGVQDYEIKGSDRFGRDYAKEREDDPAISEVDKLFEGETDKKIRDVPKFIKSEGERIDLTEDQHLKWQKKTGEYFLADLKDAIADPVWSELTDEEKIEEVRAIRKEAKADALAELELGEEVDEE